MKSTIENILTFKCHKIFSVTTYFAYYPTCLFIDQNSITNLLWICFENLSTYLELLDPPPPQYGHSQSEKKWGLRDKYNRSIKVHI